MSRPNQNKQFFSTDASSNNIYEHLSLNLADIFCFKML